MDYNSVLAKLVYLTKRNDISNAEIGNALGISRAGVSKRAIRNSKFKPDEIEKLENHFGVCFDDVKIDENIPELINPEKVKTNYSLAGRKLSKIQDKYGFLERDMAARLQTSESRYRRLVLGKEELTGKDLLNIKISFGEKIDEFLFG